MNVTILPVGRTEGGTFDPDETPCFFLAGARALTDVERYYKHLLCAVQQIDSPKHFEMIDRWVGAGGKIFLDSGIFPLTNAHARAHGVSMDEALALAPDEIDGFDDLLKQYMGLCRRLGSRLWGYTELDQGGAENKRKTRAWLEDEGLRPIPIYHPINDGWDYLDELLEVYDRICLGNVVQANRQARSELLLMAHERIRRAKKRVWVHVLGHTPNPAFVALPFNSSDSTEHIYALQYGSHQNNGRAMLANFSSIHDPAFSGDRSAKETVEEQRERGDMKAAMFSAWIAHTDLVCWEQQRSDLAGLFAETGPVYPSVQEGEKDEVRAFRPV